MGVALVNAGHVPSWRALFSTRDFLDVEGEGGGGVKIVVCTCDDKKSEKGENGSMEDKINVCEGRRRLWNLQMCF